MISVKLFGAPVILSDGTPLSGPAVQRHRLALLGLLATAADHRLARDKLIALLWPEGDQDHGRNLLNQSIHALRRTLGERALVSAGDDLRLDPSALSIDVVEFERAVTTGEAERACAVYGGPFLDGFHLADAVEFDRWSDGERARLARAYAGALESLAAEAEAAGDVAKAVGWWRRAAIHEPHNSRTALRFMQVLAVAGERAAAVQHARLHAEILKTDLGIEVDRAIVELAERLKRGDTVGDSAAPDHHVAPARSIRGSGRALTVGAAPVSFVLPRGRVVAYAGLGLVALVGVGLALALSPVRDRPVPSLAVLPLVSLSADSADAYFSEGMTEEITSALGRLRGLRVVPISRAYLATQGADATPQEIAVRMHVGAVLQVMIRRSANQLRVSARLLDAKDGSQIWAEVYARELRDVFAVQEELARAIVSALRVQLAISEDSMLAGRATQDVEANDLYLRARYFENRGGREQTVRAVENFRAAIAKDPNYAKAYAGLAEARLMGGVFNYFPLREARTEAAEAAHSAVRLDDRLAETHTALARVLAWQGDAVGADREYLRAIELNPSYAYAHAFYGELLAARGRLDQAIEEGKKGQRLDPTSAMVNRALGNALMRARRFTDAIEFYRNAAELEPSSAVTLGRLGNLYGRTGSRGAALEILHRLLEMSRSQDVWQPLAQVYAGLGDSDRALHALERARAGGYPFTAIETLPIWDPIRSDPRFREFLRRLNRVP